LVACGPDENPDDEATILVEQLAANTIVHALHASTKQYTSHPTDRPPSNPTVSSSSSYTVDEPFSRYGSNSEFQGILIDSGAAAYSTVGIAQLRAYEKLFGPVTVEKNRQINVKFGIGTTKSIGYASVQLPANLGAVIFFIVESDTPFLLSLRDLDQLGAYFNNLTNELVPRNGRAYPIQRKFGHPWLVWGRTSFRACFLSELQLRRLHRRFGHPTVERLHRLLERSGHDGNNHCQILKKISKFCQICQKAG
jgi:hypothetical protein